MLGFLITPCVSEREKQNMTLSKLISFDINEDVLLSFPVSCLIHELKSQKVG